MDHLQEQGAYSFIFISPTLGRLSFQEVFDKVVEYMEDGPDERYNLIVGTDSVEADSYSLFVSAIIIHRVGHGGRYFYRRIKRKGIRSIRQRIFYEASLSLELADTLKRELSKNGLSRFSLEIHIDVGDGGDTKEIIKEVVGMVTGSGYPAVTKPHSYGATKVADRHSK